MYSQYTKETNNYLDGIWVLKEFEVLNLCESITALQEWFNVRTLEAFLEAVIVFHIQ